MDGGALLVPLRDLARLDALGPPGCRVVDRAQEAGKSQSPSVARASGRASSTLPIASVIGTSCGRASSAFCGTGANVDGKLVYVAAAKS